MHDRRYLFAEYKVIWDKVLQNEREDIKYKADYIKLIYGKLSKSYILSLGLTPNVLQLIGAKEIPLQISQTALINSHNDED